MHRYLLDDPYLKQLPDAQFAELEKRLERWGLTEPDFAKTLDRWFGNFDVSDKDLAFKLFTHIDYYSHHRFNLRLIDLRQNVGRFLYAEGLNEESLMVVTPEGEGDSGHRHAYDLLKAWSLPRQQACRIDDLQNQPD